jgi:hypothetical protein
MPADLTPDALAAAAADDLARHQQQREAAYLRAAGAMVISVPGDPDAESMFEWHRCAVCPAGDDPCACSGVPYPSAPVRAAVDSACPDGWASTDDLLAAYTDVLGRWEAAEAEIERLRQIKRLVLTPGDTLVYETPEWISHERADMIGKQMRVEFPGHQTAIVAGGHLTILIREEVDPDV